MKAWAINVCDEALEKGGWGLKRAELSVTKLLNDPYMVI